MPDELPHELITTALSVEKLDTLLFRSKTLSIPSRARGVFGGQVISLALVAATECVDKMFALHSLHCYFLLSASDAVPLLFYVEILRQGRTYTTLSVKAVQNGRIVFFLLGSFKIPEPGAREYALPMPRVPPPEDCINEEKYYERLLAGNTLTPNQRQHIEISLGDRRRSPIDIALTGVVPYTRGVAPDGTLQHMFWMRAKAIPKLEVSFQKCIIAYLSDLRFLSVVIEASGLKGYTSSAPPHEKLGMSSSLDHTIWFYSEDFDTSDWVLYVMNAVRAGQGRGVSEGRIYSRDGQLIAVTTQEGLIRPQKPTAPTKEADEVERARL
ncbi:Thioesterase/thiol ester dehydrase-isomerase [Exidia glandulosa HHB12029]|uniref:Thioesterase/thiol ester dehydrase-isomerase n=1 Tax=Exidia glandulosa HHB12029 TaxID=1314781 RepID=A0A165PEQ8_EXIGL|nr:Thioesterase/thiol ester dehydrase-isomerase [Exidia glandulosa HHB12029]